MSSIKGLLVPRIAVVVLAAALLAACGTTKDDKPATTIGNPGAALETQKFPLEATIAPTGIQLAPHAGGLSPAQSDHLKSLVADWRASGDGMILIEMPACACDDATQTGYAAFDALRALGVADSSIRLLGYEAAPGGAIRVSYQKVTAKTYDCIKAWDDLTHTGKNDTTQNFGCAVNSNLAAMIDNPSDLLHPRPADPSDAQRNEVVSQRYRDGKATSSDPETVAGGPISDVAK